jgi:hypothetical protein
VNRAIIVNFLDEIEDHPIFESKEFACALFSWIAYALTVWA